MSDSFPSISDLLDTTKAYIEALKSYYPEVKKFHFARNAKMLGAQG